MNNNNAKLWVEALRSGKYKQGVHHLCLGDKYCCLGVACEIYAKYHTLDRKLTEDNIMVYKEPTNSREYVTSLPPAVQGWLNLTTEFGEFFSKQPATLSGQNDTGLSFDEIADLIESEPKGLFVNSDECIYS
jgi:hypothetical protein